MTSSTSTISFSLFFITFSDTALPLCIFSESTEIFVYISVPFLLASSIQVFFVDCLFWFIHPKPQNPHSFPLQPLTFLGIDFVEMFIDSSPSLSFLSFKGITLES